MKFSPFFNETCKDTLGQLPNDDLVGSSYLHHETKNVYVIAGYAFNGDTDEWHVLHIEKEIESSLVFSRSMHNFFGSTQRGEPRFKKVD